MGANFVSRGYDGKLTSEQVKKQFREDQQEASWEKGNDGYSGTIAELQGLTFSGKTFDCPDDAIKYLEATAQKYGPGIAVRSKVADLKASKRYQNAMQKCSEFERKIWQFRRENPKSKRNETYDAKMKEMWRDLHALEKELSTKSKTYRWYVGGIASS
jgi:hypothetical protein